MRNRTCGKCGRKMRGTVGICDDCRIANYEKASWEGMALAWCSVCFGFALSAGLWLAFHLLNILWQVFGMGLAYAVLGASSFLSVRYFMREARQGIREKYAKGL